VCRYNWHSAGSLDWPFSSAKVLIYFSNRIYGSSFIKQPSETVVVWNRQNVDCSLKEINLSCYLLKFSAHFRSLQPPRRCELDLTSTFSVCTNYYHSWPGTGNQGDRSRSRGQVPNSQFSGRDGRFQAKRRTVVVVVGFHCDVIGCELEQRGARGRCQWRMRSDWRWSNISGSISCSFAPCRPDADNLLDLWNTTAVVADTHLLAVWSC